MSAPSFKLDSTTNMCTASIPEINLEQLSSGFVSNWLKIYCNLPSHDHTGCIMYMRRSQMPDTVAWRWGSRCIFTCRIWTTWPNICMTCCHCDMESCKFAGGCGLLTKVPQARMLGPSWFKDLKRIILTQKPSHVGSIHRGMTGLAHKQVAPLHALAFLNGAPPIRKFGYTYG